MDFDSIKVANDGVGLALTTAASVGTAIPLAAGGVKAKQVRVLASALSFIKWGVNAALTTCTTSSTLLGPGWPEYFDVAGFSHFSAMASTTTATLNVVPLEGG